MTNQVKLRILRTADESVKNMKGELDAMKIVSQGEMKAIRASLQKYGKGGE